jgi:hypothetical protein
MSTINNLEKLIQMATIEQMYIMLEKLRANNSIYGNLNFSDIKLSSNINNMNDTNNTNHFENEFKSIKNEIQTINSRLNINNEMSDGLTMKIHDLIKIVNDKFTTNNNTINKLLVKINDLEDEISKMKNSNETKVVCEQIKGQRSLKSYPGFSNEKQNEQKKIDDVNIKLEIEEKTHDEHDNDVEYVSSEIIYSSTQLDITDLTLDMSVSDEQEDDDKSVDQSNNELDEEDDSNNEVEEEEQNKKEEEEQDKKEEEEQYDEEQEEEVEEEQEEEDDNEQEEDDEEQEEEVGTDDENEKQIKETIVKEEPIKDEQQEEQEKQEEQEEQEDEDGEDEEVFEIEIDDITYFATDEENGVLYEMTQDGDIGKKVGIIKDGEPIFN